MSNAHAIAAVTKLLVGVVDEALKASNLSGIVGSDVTVSALSPQRIDLSQGADPNQLNLFLYLALPNHGGGGVDLPTRDSSGARVRNTPLALDLSYLVTAYGADDYFAEIILGHTMQVLHENPILARDAIRAKLAPSAIPTNAELALAASGLADQLEQIKVSPEKLSTEEVSRLWSAFGADYRPSVAYRVTVLLIEADVSTQSALPVRQRGALVVTAGSPRIEHLSSKSAPDQPASDERPVLPGDILVITGKRLLGAITRVVIDGATVDASEAFFSAEHVGVPLPDTLRAGPHGVQIVHDVELGAPPTPHAGSESNVATFLLRPGITGAVLATATHVTVACVPPVGPDQHVRLLLNPLAPAPGAPGFGLAAPVDNGVDVANGQTETGSIAFSRAGVPAGSYLVRLQVDGAESVLGVDGNGAYATPSVVLP